MKILSQYLKSDETIMDIKPPIKKI